MKKRIFLISRFNTENFGDLAIAHQLLEEYSMKYEVIPISIFGDMYRHCNIDYVRNSKTLQINRIKKIMQLACLYFKLKAGDILVFGGGNMMCDVTVASASSKKYSPIVKIAKKKNCKMLALSIGFGPFLTKKQGLNAKCILDECEYITFRDENSLRRYKQLKGRCINIAKSVDTGFFYFKPNDDFSLKNSIGVNIINPDLIGFSEDKCNAIKDAYIKIIEGIVERGNKAVIFVTDKVDIPILDDIKTKFYGNDDVEILIPEGMQQLYALYLKIDALIGTRMHSMILAYSTGVPIIGISWQDKITDLFSLLENENRCYNIGSIREEVADILNDCDNVKHNFFEEKAIIKENLYRLKNMKGVNDSYVREAFETDE